MRSRRTIKTHCKTCGVKLITDNCYSRYKDRFIPVYSLCKEHTIKRVQAYIKEHKGSVMLYNLQYGREKAKLTPFTLWMRKEGYPLSKICREINSSDRPLYAAVVDPVTGKIRTFDNEPTFRGKVRILSELEEWRINYRLQDITSRHVFSTLPNPVGARVDRWVETKDNDGKVIGHRLEAIACIECGYTEVRCNKDGFQECQKCGVIQDELCILEYYQSPVKDGAEYAEVK
jgi:hypothetical protein